MMNEKAAVENREAQINAATLGLFFTLSAITTGIIFAGVSYFVFLRFLRRANRAKE